MTILVTTRHSFFVQGPLSAMQEAPSPEFVTSAGAEDAVQRLVNRLIER
jgi:hypothetical protein